jgi:hypothetical protein
MNRCASKVLAGLTLLVLLGASRDAAAQGGPGHFWLGNDLHAACTGGNEAQLQTCTGYVMAIVDVVAEARNDGTARACVPFNIARQHVVDVTVAYLRENPQLWRRHASSLVMAALNARYPCP